MNDFLRVITAQYALYVFLACLGVLQLAGARARRRRLCLLPGRRASALLGACSLAAGYLYFFFLGKARYYARGLEGAQLFTYFALGACVAVLVCSWVHVVRSGQIGSARRRLLGRLHGGVAELRPLFERSGPYREDESA